MRKEIFNSILWRLVDRLASQVCMFLVIIYLARSLGPYDFGLIGMLAVFTQIADSLINNGFSQALIQKSNKVTNVQLSTVFYSNLILSIIIYGLFYTLTPYIALFYDQNELILIAKVLFIIIIINSFSVVSRAKLSIDFDFKSQAKANALASILSGIIAVLFVNFGFGYWALVALNISRSIVYVIMLWVLCKWRPLLEFSYSEFNKLFKFASKLMFAGILSTILNNIYSILIGRYFNATQVGFYTQGVSLTNTISELITSVLQGATFPVLSSLKEDKSKLIETYSYLLKLSMLISFPCMFGFAVIAETFTVTFLGEKWLPIVPILIYLALARSMAPIGAINMNILNAIGRSDLFLKVEMVKIPFILIFVFVSLPYGITALAFSNLLLTIITFVINTYYPGRIFNIGFLSQVKMSLKIFLSALIMSLSIYFIDISSGVYELIVKVMLGFIIYVLCLVALKEKLALEIISKIFKKFSDINH